MEAWTATARTSSPPASYTADNQIDVTTGTVRLKAQFPNAEGKLFPNQFVNVRMLVQTLTDATLIPTAAIQRGAPGTFVYVVNDDSTVVVTPVKLGPAQGEVTAIASGLALGAHVVVDGTDKLREGAKVDVITRDAQAVAPAAGARRGPRGEKGAGARPPGDAGSGKAPPAPAGAPPPAPPGG